MYKTMTVAALGAAAALSLAACGGSNGSTSSGGSTNPLGTPKSAATAYLASLSSNDAATICKYVHVSNTSDGGCVDLLSQGLASKAGDFSGTISAGNSAQQGTQAIVVAVGNAKFLDTPINNTDPNAGLPSGSTTFAQAYQAAAQPSAPDIQMIEVSGSWYANLG
jgi:hypothetical protein